MNLRLLTPRLELVAGDAELARLEGEDPPAFARRLRAQVPLGWPPPPHHAGPARWPVSEAPEDPEAPGWGVWYFLLREGPGLVAAGSGGFRQRPSRDGVVEIGYSFLPEFQGRGLATEAVRALTAWAFAQRDVRRVAAETAAALRASVRVLEKNGFAPVGRGGEDGAVRFERVAA